MKKQHRVQRLALDVPTLAEPSAEPIGLLPAADTEPRQLAHDVFRAFADELARFLRTIADDPEQEDPRKAPTQWSVELVNQKPDQDVTFFDLERLARIDPALMLARWEKMKASAREDLTNGWLAARTLEFLGGSAGERAAFLAVREQLYQAWQPRHAGEALLLDEMAQYEMLRMQWVGMLAMLSREPSTVTTLGRKFQNDDEPRKLTRAQAAQEALRTVERVQRLYQNSLRMLLSMRRGKTTLVMGRVGQVYMAAGQQMNVECSSQDPHERGVP